MKPINQKKENGTNIHDNLFLDLISTIIEKIERGNTVFNSKYYSHNTVINYRGLLKIALL